MIRTARKCTALFAFISLLAIFLSGAFASAETDDALWQIPQIDCSTARIPITDAIYEHLRAPIRWTALNPYAPRRTALG